MFLCTVHILLPLVVNKGFSFVLNSSSIVRD